MTNPTDLRDHDLESDLRALLRVRAEVISGAPPGLADRPPHEPGSLPAAPSRARRWLTAGAAAAVLAVGAIGFVLSGERSPTEEIAAGGGETELGLDPKPADPVVWGPFESSDEAVRSFLERTVGVETTAAASLEGQPELEYEPGLASRQWEVTLPGGDPFAVITLLRDGTWSVMGSSRSLSASSPLLLQVGTGVELLFAYTHDADHAVVWYQDSEGQTLEAEIDGAAMESDPRDVLEEVGVVYEAYGFTRAQGREFAEKLDLSTIERARVPVPGSVDVDGRVVVASFDADGRPLAVWTSTNPSG